MNPQQPLAGGNDPAPNDTYNGALETNPTNGSNRYRGRVIANTPLGASITSFFLGAVFATGLSCILAASEPTQGWPLLAVFITPWAAFHWGEYAVAAGWNRSRCSVDSFLLENGAEYHSANGFAVLEFVTCMLFAPQWKRHSFITYTGIAVTLTGQILRSSAMITAASNFSHQVVVRREESHRLVTNGIYSILRHPSYTGFFYWSLGTQMILQNPISFLGFTIVLWRFFSQRIQYEERYLIVFFGKEYEVYRKRVGTWIPFIR